MKSAFRSSMLGARLSQCMKQASPAALATFGTACKFSYTICVKSLTKELVLRKFFYKFYCHFLFKLKFE